jgi:hexosaminidase
MLRAMDVSRLVIAGRAPRTVRGMAGLAAALVALQTVSCVAPAEARAAQRRPLVIPALQLWYPTRGTWQLGTRARIIIRHADRKRLLQEARLLASDLGGLLRRRIPVTADRGVHARRGDVVLALSPPDRRLGAEGYRLSIETTFAISAPTPTGVFYGGRTLLQLVHEDQPIVRGHARDWPRYPERGLMLDVSRTVYPVAWIETEIKQLAYLKMNLLHLHLTDDQRWGIASSTHPEIVGPHAFTKHDIRDILRVASRYHVLVVPEIDMPGHMAALLAKHSDLELKVEGAGASSAPSEYVTDKLDITNPAALAIVRQLLDEYLPLFPGPYWDMGDDEYMSPAQYPLYPQLAAYAIGKYGPRASIADAIHGFINRVDAIVRAHHKTLRIWNDQLAGASVVPVNPDVVVDWWINTSPFGDPVTVPPATLLSEGHRVLNAGWFPTYYTTDLGPVAGKSDMQQAYEDWQVNEFEGPESTTDMMQPPQTVSSSASGLLGSILSVWGPLPETISQTAAGIAPRLAVIAQKTWNSPVLTPSYAEFQRIIAAIGSAPR